MKKTIEIIVFVDFVKKNIESDKDRDHCRLTGEYRGPAHCKCSFKVSRNQSIFIPFLFHSFNNYSCHLFFIKVVDIKHDTVKFEILPKTNEEYISIRYGCIRFIDSYRFVSGSLDSLVKIIVDSSHKTLNDFEKEIVNEIKILTREDRYKNDYPDEVEKLEVSLNFMGQNDLKVLKTEFPDKWNVFT